MADTVRSTTREEHLCNRCHQFTMCNRFRKEWLCPDCLNYDQYPLELEVIWHSNGNMDEATGDAVGVTSSGFRRSVRKGSAKVGGPVQVWNPHPGR